jgi:hypothetical protein
MRKVAIFSIVTLLLILTISEVAAKRLLPHLAKYKASQAASVAVSVKFRSDRQAIIATFGSVANATKIDYVMSYDTNGLTQGAQGTIVPGTLNQEVRELLFGTCSKGICRYDTHITNAKFTVTVTLTNGKKIVKPFRLKV